MSTILFIDTEFTDFTNMELISIGAVTETGTEFYAEITDHIAEYRSDFVNQVVIPLLDIPTHGMSHHWAGFKLVEWINTLPGDTITVVVDYGGDWILMDRLIHPHVKLLQKQLHCVFINHAIRQVLNERGYHTPELVDKATDVMWKSQPDYYVTDNRQHHALVDAQANRYGWIQGCNAVK